MGWGWGRRRRGARFLAVLFAVSALGSWAALAPPAFAAPPSNDGFAGAQVITGDSGTATGTNIDATKECNGVCDAGPGDEPDHAEDTGGASVWFDWTAPTSGAYTFDTAGSDFDTLLAIYTGGSVGTLDDPKKAPSDDQSGPGDTSSVKFDAIGGTTYHIAVDGYAGGQPGASDQGAITLNWFTNNDDFDDARAIGGLSGTTTSTNVGATKEPDEPDHFGDSGGASVWFDWEAPAGGLQTFHTEGSDFDTVVAVYTGNDLEDLDEVASDDQSGPGNTSRLNFLATQNTTYHVAVDGFGGAEGAITLSWLPSEQPENDGFADAQVMASSVSGTNVDATKEAGEPIHADDPGGTSVWFDWTAGIDGSQTFDTAGSDFDTLLAVYTGNAVDSLTELASNDDANGSLTSKVVFDADAGTTYHIAVDGFFGEQGAIALNRTGVEPPLPPFVLDLSPSEATKATGGTVTLTATVTTQTGQPVAGEPVTWSETGPGAFQQTDGATDANGVARAKVMSSTVGDQVITAEAASCAPGGTCSDSSTVHWVPPPPVPPFSLVLTPKDTSTEVGNAVTLTATVRNQAGQPVAGEPVNWSETGPGAFEQIDGTTDANGEARATVRSLDAGEQTITAFTSSCAAGGDCSDNATVHWTTPVSPPPPPPEAECDLTGTNGDDVLIGTGADETVCGLGGHDFISGAGGDDTLKGGTGRDEVRGGTGRDLIRGGRGNDSLFGGRGRDVLIGGRGGDLLKGGRGADDCRPGPGRDRVVC